MQWTVTFACGVTGRHGRHGMGIHITPVSLMDNKGTVLYLSVNVVAGSRQNTSLTPNICPAFCLEYASIIKCISASLE